MLKSEYETNARNGATLLDSTIPGWYNKIDSERLYLGYCYDCVLGQLHQPTLWNKLCRAVCLDYNPYVCMARQLDVQKPHAYGFEARTMRGYVWLTAAWRHEIAERKALDAQYVEAKEEVCV